MKKFFALLLTLMLLVSFAACDSQEPTMRQLIDANHSETLLKTYDSLYVHVTMNGEMYTDYYLTDTYSYEQYQDHSIYLTDNTGYGCRNGVYERLVFLTRDGLISNADYQADQYADLVLSQDSVLEKIQSITETGDQITVKSVMSRKPLKKLLGAENLRSYEAMYVMDAKTLSLITTTGVFTFDDETTIDFSAECTYNAEMPEEIKPFLEYQNQTEDLRTVTLVFHSGTKKEKAECVQAPKGLPVTLSLPPDCTEGFSVYADAACTELYQSNGDYTSDLTIYIK